MKVNMTREEAAKWIPILQAYVDGKVIEFRGVGFTDWSTHGAYCFNSNVDEYRIKSEPKLRPWKQEEVPLGCSLRHKSLTSIVSIIGCKFEKGVSFHDASLFISRTYQTLLDSYEHSTDGGKTWLPCGVMEE